MAQSLEQLTRPIPSPSAKPVLCAITAIPLHADFEDASGRKLAIEVRAFDDGVAFRYIVPAQSSSSKIRIEHELTEFRYTKDAALYPLILEGFQSSYEDEYQLRHVSGIHRDWLIGLPLLAEVPAVGWVAVTEADIDNYAGMYLRKGDAPLGLRAELSPRVDAPYDRRRRRHIGYQSMAGSHDCGRSRPPG